jgi:DNA-binding transcriptional regulator YiaG
MKKERMRKAYRYTECGLDNIIIENVEVIVDDDGEEIYCIPDILTLHKAIAHAVITREAGLSGKEVRFLRTEMGYTQSEFANILRVSRPTINRWERGKTGIDSNAEVIIRMLAAEKLGINPKMTIEKMAKNCVWKAEKQVIWINGEHPEKYRKMAA